MPLILSGKFTAGANLVCGEGVVIDVAEEVVVGDRCVLPDNAYLGGRRVNIGDDFYGYSWEFSRLDVGRGRRDDEYAVLVVGPRCTFHDNKIDLSRAVAVGADVGLSPEVVIYTHGYWRNPLLGYPCNYEPVTVGAGTVVGFRSTLLPGARIPDDSVIGAGSVVTGPLTRPAVSATQSRPGVFAGVPARYLGPVELPSPGRRGEILDQLVLAYNCTLEYRGLSVRVTKVDYPRVEFAGCRIDAEAGKLEGAENPDSDDFRDFLFRHGIRVYTKRPFRKLGRIPA